MNYDILCRKKERLEEMWKHFPKEALETYAVDGDLQPFAGMIASLEEQRLDEYLGMLE